jgi:hypothetical protein
MKKNPHIGESFESFLRDEGLHEEVAATAVKRTFALQSWSDQSFTDQSAVPDVPSSRTAKPIRDPFRNGGG